MSPDGTPVNDAAAHAPTGRAVAYRGADAGGSVGTGARVHHGRRAL